MIAHVNRFVCAVNRVGTLINTMSAPSGSSQDAPRRTYRAERAVGQGTFGTVMSARSESGERVAIKKVLQDPRFKNRELQIMRSLSHTNVTMLRDYFYTHGESHPDEVYLNVVMEFVPETLHRVCRDHTKLQRAVPLTLVRLFMFQLLRSIAYLHLPSVNVCHRDIKPHNLLVDVAAGVLKICDFGSAKQLSPSEANVAYICSRYYRAPELIFGNTFYSTSIDVWSVGCIFAEMLTGEPFFKGDNSMSQLIEIIKVLGTPTKEQLNALTTRTDMRIPNIQAKQWSQIFKEHVPKSAHELCAKLLEYVPTDRYTPWEALVHPFFDELHDPALKLPHNGAAPPENLFKWSEDEIKAMTPAQQAKLVKK
jgi:serine/threonine protein kinase